MKTALSLVGVLLGAASSEAFTPRIKSSLAPAQWSTRSASATCCLGRSIRPTGQAPTRSPYRKGRSLTCSDASMALPQEASAIPESAKKQSDGWHDEPIVEPLFVGIRKDIARKSKWYATDFKDGFNLKGLAAIFFLFFACLAPAVAFGGLMGKVTNGAIGTMEMILATAYNGMAYALFSGQPLTIIGSTGPVLAFTIVLYRTAVRLGLPFLPLYSWVGIWTSLLLFLSSITSLSNMVSYFTRFTDEIFSLLISLIFIFEACKDIGSLITNPAVPLAQSLLSLLTATTTFFAATRLAGVRKGTLFNKKVRDGIADFGPSLGVVGGCLLATYFKTVRGEALTTLLIPTTFSTTIGRPWLVDLFALPTWARWASFVPAVMSTVLLWMDQNITVRLVNSAKHRLKKGFGMHLDMLMVSILTFFNSLLGFPWLVAATVRSLNHVRALAYFKKNKAGEYVIESMMENRLTGFMIHALIGTSVLFFRPLLSTVPLAVLMGLFLYLGQSSLGGNQMWERLWLLITDPQLRPDHAWARKVPFKTSARFTALQFACLAGMWGLKSSRIGVLFPLLIAALAPIRVLIEKLGWFSKEDLAVLDSETEDD